MFITYGMRLLLGVVVGYLGFYLFDCVEFGGGFLGFDRRFLMGFVCCDFPCFGWVNCVCWLVVFWFCF